MPVVLPSEETPADVSAVPLDDVKAHLNIRGTANDVELQRFIDAAEAAIAHKTGPLQATTVVEKHNGGGANLILDNPRAISLTSIAYDDGTTTTLGDFDLDTATGIVWWNYNTAGRFTYGSRNVTVTYEAGFDPLPEDLTHAVKELVRHLWQTQRPNNLGRPGFTDVDAVNPEPVAGAYSSWPLRVQELVAPYVVPIIA